MKSELTLDASVSIPPHVVSKEVGDDTVYLNTTSENYYSLDATGTRFIAESIAQPSLGKALEVLCEEFEAEPEMLRSDLLELVGSLVEAGLLQTA